MQGQYRGCMTSSFMWVHCKSKKYMAIPLRGYIISWLTKDVWSSIKEEYANHIGLVYNNVLFGFYKRFRSNLVGYVGENKFHLSSAALISKWGSLSLRWNNFLEWCNLSRLWFLIYRITYYGMSMVFTCFYMGKKTFMSIFTCWTNWIDLEKLMKQW